VWLASLGVGALLVQVSPIESLFSKIVAVAMVAIAAYMIGYAVGPTLRRVSGEDSGSLWPLPGAVST